MPLFTEPFKNKVRLARRIYAVGQTTKGRLDVSIYISTGYAELGRSFCNVVDRIFYDQLGW